MAPLSDPRENDIRISTAAAIESAKSGVIAYSLDNDPVARNALENGYPNTPLLVERFDKQGSDYYLVPWRVQEGVVFVAKVDALSGVFLGATVFPEPAPSFYLSPDQALEHLRQEFPQYKPGVPRLVWQPCRQSTDSMIPFYQIPVNSRFLFVNMDGSVFKTPTPLDFGG